MGRMNAVWTWIRTHGGQLLWGVLFLFLGAAALRWWVGPQVQTEAVQRRDLLQTVVASGRVETPHRVDIGAQITGTVARVPVAEGQVVKAGDVLIELVSTELQSAQRQAEQAVMQAKGRLRQLTDLQGPVAQQMLRQAQASLDAARASGQRSLALFEQGFIGQAALDESRKALTLAEAGAKVVVIDDGSTDNVEEVAGRYPGVRYIQQENQGLAGARNTGLRRSARIPVEPPVNRIRWMSSAVRRGAIGGRRSVGASASQTS